MASGLLAKLLEAIGLNMAADGVSNTSQGQAFQQEYVDPLMQKGADVLQGLIPSAQAAELPAPVIDRTQPAPSINQVFPQDPTSLISVPPVATPASNDGVMPFVNKTPPTQLPDSPMADYIKSDATAPITDDEFESLVKNAVTFNSKVDMDPEFRNVLATAVGEEGPAGKTGQEIDFNKKIGSIWDSTFGDEEWRLRKAMIINSMRLNPDAALTQAFASRIKDLRKRKGAEAMAKRLELTDADKYATLITGLRNGDLEAKDVISTVYRAPSSTQQKMDLFKSDPVLARNMAEAGLFGAPPTKSKEWDKGQVSFVQDAASEYRAAGQGAVNLQNQLNRFAMQIAQMPEGTGPSQETLAQLTELAAKVGMPVDTSKVTDAQSLAAASGMLVAEQLRLNKGPQTDFDANFTATFFPSMGLTTEANNKIIDYLTSVNRINTYKASRASALLAKDPDAGIKGLTELDEMTYNFPAVMQNSSGQWVTFNSYMNNPALEGKSEQEKIDGWLDAYKATRQ